MPAPLVGGVGTCQHPPRMDDAGLPLDFYLTETDRALLAAPSIHELVEEWQRLGRAGLALLSSGSEDPLARGRLVRALAAGAALSRATVPREVAEAVARICSEVAASQANDGLSGGVWEGRACELACWTWLAA